MVVWALGHPWVLDLTGVGLDSFLHPWIEPAPDSHRTRFRCRFCFSLVGAPKKLRNLKKKLERNQKLKKLIET
jgi:hypothetical protein